MNKNIVKLFLILACSSWSSTSIYVEINPDSLEKSSNISFLTSSILLNQDSLYCEQLVQEHKKGFLSTKDKPISKFKCNDLEVSEFTFFGYQDEFVNLIYKPIGSKKEFFGKAKIKKNDLLHTYLIENKDAAFNPMSEIEFENISKKAGITTISVIVVSTIVLSVFLFVSVLATLPFH